MRKVRSEGAFEAFWSSLFVDRLLGVIGPTEDKPRCGHNVKCACDRAEGFIAQLTVFLQHQSELNTSR